MSIFAPDHPKVARYQLRHTVTSDPWIWEVELNIESITLFDSNLIHLTFPILNAEALTVEADNSKEHAPHIRAPFLYVCLSINLEAEKNLPKKRIVSK